MVVKTPLTTPTRLENKKKLQVSFQGNNAQGMSRLFQKYNKNNIYRKKCFFKPQNDLPKHFVQVEVLRYF